jgi:uncharacterized membrane protein YGL010W
VAQVIHIIFVPMLLWSAFVILSLAVHRNVSFLAWLAYAAFYFYMDPVVGSVAGAFYFAIWVSSDMLVNMHRKKQGVKAVPALTKGAVWAIAASAQVLGWGAQGERECHKR